ncbi:MAG: glutamine synthetase type III, partial [Clostridiales bacterium]|nr:glutamine synthetase type III [Clostridiales bacterium]
KNLLEETSSLLKQTQEALNHLIEIESKAYAMEEGRKQAEFYHEKVVTAMEALRKPVDQLEMIVDKEMWPMPSYGDLIFEV